MSQRPTPRFIACLLAVSVAGAGLPRLLADAPRAVLQAQGQDTRPDRTQPTSQPSGVVDEDLVRRLLGGRTTALDTVEQTLARMDEAAKRLTDRLDPGEKTQAIQKEILDGLDQLIETARQSRAGRTRKRSVRRRSDRSRPGQDARRVRRDTRSDQSIPAPKGGRGAADTGRRTDRKKTGLEKADLARRWGFLPQRDRDELTQGFGETFLPKYREQILRYYRELARAAEKE
ncbi:MAG: hypothetical protein ACE5E1_03050 [Phycisphaerae bacterium]